MAKIIAALLFLAMITQIIKPFGLPGFRKRSDFWKIAVVALITMMVLVTIRP